MASEDMSLDDDFMETMLSDFLDESDGYMRNLNEKLMVLDQLISSAEDPKSLSIDRSILNEMFRDAHSLKGLSAMLRLGNINSLTHRIENLFDAAREQRLTLTAEVVELLFEAFDRLSGMIENLMSVGNDHVEFKSVSEAIQKVLDDADVGSETLTKEQMHAAVQNTRNSSPAEDSDNEQAITSIGDSEQSASTADATPLSDPFAGVTDEIETSQKYLSIFVEETLESLDELYDSLSDVNNDAQVNRILTRCHQIKGSAASIGLQRPAKLAHLMEDLLQEVREANREIDEAIANALSFAADAIRAYAEKLQAGDRPIDDNFSDAYRRLLQGLNVGKADADAPEELTSSNDRRTSCDTTNTGDGVEEIASRLDDLDALISQKEVLTNSEFRSSTLLSEERERICLAAPADRDSVIGMAQLKPGIPLADVKVQLLFNRLEEAGELFFRVPDENELAEADLSRILFGVASDWEVRQVRDAIDLDGVTKITLESLSSRRQEVEIHGDSAISASEQGRGAHSAVAPQSDGAPQESSRPEAPGAETGDRTEEIGASSASLNTQESVAKAEGKIGGKGDSDQSVTDTGSPQSTKQKPAETLRVDIERLDQLMNLAGQLVINRARFGQIHEKLKSLSMNKHASTRLAGISDQLSVLLKDTEELSDTSQDASALRDAVCHQVTHVSEDLELLRSDVQQIGEARGLINQLSDAVHQLERISDEIQQSVMDTRMVPIGPLFSRFKRVVRDITRINAKRIELAIRGEKTELDKRMIDELTDPLIHMVRNSADHGIESLQERRDAGKPELGKITLDAFHRGNRVMIKIHDDGRGLDPEKLKAKAISKGIVTQQDAERMTPHEALQLIWEPGFSTAETITEISGRGMGMDIVRSKIEQLNGSVELESETGVGTTITVKLPLTMAILPCLLSVIDGDTFAIPVESVVEIVRVQRKDLPTVGGAVTARIRGRVIPVVSLRDLFDWNDRFSTSEPEPEEYTLVIVGTESGELGLSVEDLVGEEDIVVKSLAENYRNVHGLSGASILGDGCVSLILDVAAMMEMASRRPATAASNFTEIG
jgi:two-component system, chemotaxis family, sensor kinase CheA